MEQALQSVIDFIVGIIGSDQLEPGWLVLVYVLFGCAVLVILASRFREEIRSQQWTAMTPAERRAKIYDILNEAHDVAEWLFSSKPKPLNQADKISRGAEKKKVAVKYAREQLGLMGASTRDLASLSNRIELVCRDDNRGEKRYADKSQMGPV